MKHSKYQPYVAVGVTAFCVIAGAILFFFLLLKKIDMGNQHIANHDLEYLFH